MSYTRNQKFTGFQTEIKNHKFFKFQFDAKKILKNTVYKGLLCGVILMVLFTMKIINKSPTNSILESIYTKINSEFEYTYYLSKVKEFPQFAFEKGERALEVISFPNFNEVQYAMPIKGDIISFFDQSSTTAQTNTRGIVIKTNENESVVASQDGIVMEVGTQDSIGGYVIIKHKGNLLTIYKHLEESIVENDQMVKLGDVIGLSTEKLQFEMWNRNSPIDPLRYLDLK